MGIFPSLEDNRIQSNRYALPCSSRQTVILKSEEAFSSALTLIDGSRSQREILMSLPIVMYSISVFYSIRVYFFFIPTLQKLVCIQNILLSWIRGLITLGLQFKHKLAVCVCKSKLFVAKKHGEEEEYHFLFLCLDLFFECLYFSVSTHPCLAITD